MVAFAAVQAKDAKPQMIWEYQKELGLSAKQQADMRAAVAALRQQVNAKQPKLQSTTTEVQHLIAGDAPIPVIRAKLHDLASLQIDLKVADIETARKINALMTPRQLAKWHDIQARTRKAHK